VVALEPEIDLVEELTQGIDLAAARTLVIGQVAAELTPEIDRAVAAVERDQAEAELEPAQAVVEREHVPAAPVLARGHPHARLAVAPTTKSVTAAHRRDLVPLLAAEDLAAGAAETTREPAAAEAVIAWEVAE